jgi:hypothetical protein
MDVKYDDKAGKLHITLDVNKGKVLSSTGKTFQVASSNGNQSTTISIDGQCLKVGVNAFIANPEFKAAK